MGLPRSVPVYLDCAATTPLDERVRDEVLRFWRDEWGNAGSRTHEYGRRARKAVEQARDRVAAVVAAGRGEVVFTSGATESNNLAILGLAEEGERSGRKHVVSTMIEHPAVLEPLRVLEKRGFEVTLVPPGPGGWVDPKGVSQAVRPDTLLVSVMHVNNETGVIQPIEEIARLLEGHESYLHVDAAQSFGKEFAALRNPRVDLISVSGHKIFAPAGIGALVVRRRGQKRVPLAPIMHGGGQELGLRPGTVPAHLVVGLGRAAELAWDEAGVRREACLAFRRTLMEGLAGLELVVNGDEERCVPHIVNVSFAGIDGDAAIEAIEDVVAVSNGSACTSSALTCSHVLGAMGLEGWRAEGAVRFSWWHGVGEVEWGEVVRRLGSFGAAGNLIQHRDTEDTEGHREEA